VFEVYDMASKQKYDLALLVRLSSLNEIVGQRLNGPWPFLKEDLACDIWETVEMVRLPDLLLFQLGGQSRTHTSSWCLPGTLYSLLYTDSKDLLQA
jgi:hypothetical protein